MGEFGEVLGQRGAAGDSSRYNIGFNPFLEVSISLDFVCRFNCGHLVLTAMTFLQLKLHSSLIRPALQNVNTSYIYIFGGNLIKFSFSGTKNIVLCTFNQGKNVNFSCQIPDSSKTTEFKKGFVMRKCCVDPDGRRSKYRSLLVV